METKEYEIRNITAECRAVEDNGKKYIEGYAILYDHRSKMLFSWGDPFYEVISRGAFDEILANPNLDVIYTPNHNYDLVVARTVSGTLQLINDEKGLKYRAEVPNIGYANDLYESIKRGDIFESSFTFMVGAEGQNWTKSGEGIDLRTVTKASDLREVASVTWGAYSDTKVAARSLQNMSNNIKVKDMTASNLDLFNKKLTLKKLIK